VLVLLLLNANEVVSADRLIDELWGNDPPQDASAALQAHVSRLRKLLEPERDGDPRVIRTVSPGYLIQARDEDLDLLRFESLVAEARARLDGGEAAAAAATLREALAMWRGRPLADLESEPFARDPIRELDEMWLEAVELRVDADLATGRHADLVRELSALARRYPLREGVRRRLMLALYRSGRQAEALAAYADLRRTLVEELGLEPCRELRALQEAMLRQDPELDLRQPGAVRVVPRRRRRLWAALAIALAAVAAVGLLALLGSEDTRAPPRSEGLAVAVSPHSGEVQAQVPVGATPSAVAVGEGRVWVLNADDQTISRIDPSSSASDTFAIGATPTDLVVGAGAVWVGSGGAVPRGQTAGLVATALARIDPGSRAPRATIPLPAAGTAVATNAGPDHIAVTPRAVWAIGPDERVRRVDPRVNRITATIAGVRARAIAADRSSVWILAGDGAVTRIDARTNEVLSRGTVSASSVVSIAAGRDGAWISAPADGTVWRAVPGRGERLVMDTTRVPTGMTEIAYGAGALWGVNPLRGTLTQLDPGEGSVVRTIPVGGFPRGVAVGTEAVWVVTAPAAGGAPPASKTTAGVTPLPASFCERPFYGGSEPANRLVVSDLPLQGGLRVSSQQMADAMAFVLRQRGFRAGRWRVAYQSCDDAVAATRLPDNTKCASNARTYGRSPDVIALVGPLNSGCALAAVPELGRAPGPLAIVSPFASYSGLTRAGPGTPPGELRSLYPTERRNFLRVYPADDHQVAALALLAKRLRGAPVYVLDDGDDEYGRLFADQFEHSASALGVPIAGRASWKPGAPDYGRLAVRVARSRPRAVFLGGQLDTGGAAVVRALRDQLGDRVAILVPNAFPPSLLIDQAGSAAGGVFVALTGIAGADQLRIEGRRFARAFTATLAGETLEPSAIYAAQAMDVVLDAIRRSDGTRASVLQALFETRIRNGLIGTVSFDHNGDIETSPVTILRVEPGARKHPLFPGAVVDRVLQVPVGLLR
jgi:DNA-binding SARP family transcriptional activator/ABC-type branched-subunit amino acid transport system substrate-binding protein/DNA-binding beta-propeller fold protein YncE